LPVFYRTSSKELPSVAPTITHVHGFAISGTYLLPAANLVAADYQTFVPDLPGFGRSADPHPPDYRPAALADAVLAFMDTMGIEKATLLGNFTGCIVALECARRFPHRLARLILVSPAGGSQNQPMIRGLWQLFMDNFREPVRMIPIAIGDYLRFGMLDALRLFRSMMGYAALQRLTHTPLPTLVVFGDRDPLVSEHKLRAAAAGIERITLARIDGAAHAVNFSHPEELASVVRRYLMDQPIVDEPACRGHGCTTEGTGGMSSCPMIL
jgi:pimeloyl-ACP methyl ester carboxylesterase